MTQGGGASAGGSGDLARAMRRSGIGRTEQERERLGIVLDAVRCCCHHQVVGAAAICTAMHQNRDFAEALDPNVVHQLGHRQRCACKQPQPAPSQHDKETRRDHAAHISGLPMRLPIPAPDWPGMQARCGPGSRRNGL
jgi:hypothetical protein